MIKTTLLLDKREYFIIFGAEQSVTKIENFQQGANNKTESKNLFKAFPCTHLRLIINDNFYLHKEL